MKIDVKHVAKLSNLSLGSGEIEKLESQLDDTIEYIKKLEEVKTANIEPTSQVTGLENITREDISTQSLSQEEALSNSKETHNGLFRVKAILENS